jgi:hypothetical protein
MPMYELYQNDEPVMSFHAEGHVRNVGLSDTLSLYGVSPDDQAEINKHVAPMIQPPNEKRSRLYKIFDSKPD